MVYKLLKTTCGQTEVIREANTHKEIMHMYNGIISNHIRFGIYVVKLTSKRSVLPAFGVEYRVKRY